MISMVKIASGEDAWRYFHESVAVEAGRGDAVEYYAAEGTPAGRWYGAGVVGLRVAEGRTVMPAELSHLYGAGAHPLTGEPLARRYVVVATLDERVDARVKQLDTSLDDATRGTLSPRSSPRRRRTRRHHPSPGSSWYSTRRSR